MLPDAGSGLLCPIPIIDASHPPVLLVVDDDAPVRDLLVRQLEQHGYATRQASSGIEALELIEQHQFDVVLLDVGMPSMNGYQGTPAHPRRTLGRSTARHHGHGPMSE